MRVALDVMGGDFAPTNTIEGALAARAAYPDIEIVLVGPEEQIAAELAAQGPERGFEIAHASEVIEMDDHPANAVRAKPDSSIVVGMKMLKAGEVDAFFSAGNTGGMLAAGILHLGRIRGVKRPALSVVFPTPERPPFVLDIGANADVRPDYLQQFALMGSIYVEKVLGRSNPAVGLLSNGEEAGKGNELVKEAFKLIEQLPINFQGNAEGRDLTSGRFDVIVTDGFTGNVAIKTAEGVAELIRDLIRESFKGDPLSMLAGALYVPFGYKRVRKSMSADEVGGAPLLGLNGVALVGHGSSSAYAIQHGIRAARDGARSGYVEAIREGLAQLKEAETG